MIQQEQKTQPKNKNLLKIILVVAGFTLVIGLLIVEGILGWILIKNLENEQNSLKSSQEETKNQYSNLQESIKTNSNDLDEIKGRITDLEEQSKASEAKEKDSSTEEASESEESSTEENKETSSNCNFSKEVTLRTTDNYDIFGGSEFDTVVCGYISIQNEIVWEEEQENAYFVITQYKDEKFRESIVEGIKNGNAVNKKIGDHYAFNLGCKEDEKISGMQYKPDETYLDEATQSKILSSTQDNFLSLIISFDKHEGTGCNCCNLASKIRLY